MPYPPTVFVDVPDPAHPPGGAVPIDATELNKMGFGIRDAMALAEAAAASASAGVIDIAGLGAACDTVISRNPRTFQAVGSMTSGSADVTGLAFASWMIGKTAVARGAGAAGATLVTTVTGNNGTKPTLAVSASTTVGGTDVAIGTDDTAVYASANILAAAAPLNKRIRLGAGASITRTTIGPGDVVGRGQKSSVLVAAAAVAPVVQLGNTTLVPPTYRGDGLGYFTVLGMGIATGLVHSGASVNSQIRNIDGQNSAPGGYGLRVELAQNHEFSLIQMTSIGGNCLEIDSAAGGHAFDKCEWDNSGIGTTGNSYFNATVRQTTPITIGGYKNPTDITFRDNIFERGASVGRGGVLYVGNCNVRFLFDGCNFAIGGDITATNPGVVRAAISVVFEDHNTITGDLTTGKNGLSAISGLEFRGCSSQGSRGKIELNTNNPTDGWRVRDQSWTVDVDVATGGTFTLTDQNSGQTTGAQAWNLSPAALQAALEGLGVIGAGNVGVTQSGSIYTITLQGALTYVNPLAAGIKLIGSGAGLTGPSPVNFAVGVLNSASPTIALLINGGGKGADVTIDGGAFFNHACIIAADDDCVVNVKSMPRMSGYGDLFLNPPQSTTNIAGTVTTRGSVNSKTFNQVMQMRTAIPYFRSSGVRTDASASAGAVRPLLDGEQRIDPSSGRVYYRQGANNWVGLGLQTDSALAFTLRASSWIGPTCPVTTRAVVLSGATSTQINAGQVYAIPIDLPTTTVSFTGVNLITTVAAVLSAAADATHYCRARLAAFTDAAGLADTLIAGTEVTIDLTPAAGAQNTTYASVANTSTVRRVWVLCVFEGQGVTTWPTVTSSNLGLTVSSSTPPTSVLPTLGGLKESSASNPNGSGVFTFVGYNPGLVGQPIGAAPLPALRVA